MLGFKEGQVFLETVIPGKVNIVPSVILKFQGILSHSWTATEVKNRVDKAVRYVEAEAVCLRKNTCSKILLGVIF